MWLIKVASVVYFTAVCAAQEPPSATSVSTEVTPPSSPPTIAATPTVYDIPVPSLHQQSRWLDVFPSEIVELNCSITGSSDWTFAWFKDGVEIPHSDTGVSFSAEGSILTITAVQTYSGMYTCKGHHKAKGVTTPASNSLSLTVNTKKPKPTVKSSSTYDKMFPRETVNFSCAVDLSTDWEYLWYHEGKEIQKPAKVYKIDSIGHSDSGRYHCKAKRGKAPFYTEESDTTVLQVADPPTPSVRLQTSWRDVFENETVKMVCDVSGSDWMFTWYRNKQQLDEDAVPDLDEMDPHLNMTLITQEYQGEYACKVHLDGRGVSSGFSDTVNITVYENIPKPTLSKTPGLHPMYVGETVIFTCNVDVSSGWEYQWYKDGKTLSATNKTFSIQLGPSARGNYSCSATRADTSTEMSEEMHQGVLEIPLPSLKRKTKWPHVFPDESVRLSCEMESNAGWTYMWNKDGQKVKAGNGVSFDSNESTLSINSASAAHAGKYNCKGGLAGRPVSSDFSSGFILSVYDKKPEVTLIQDPDYDLMFPGEPVSLTCGISVVSEWEYLWYKDDKSLGVTGNTYSVSSVVTANQGSYRCQARRGTSPAFLTDSSQARQLNVKENKPKPSMIQQPGVANVYVGESVSFQCQVGLSSGWEYFWYKDGAQLNVSSSSFKIPDASLLDSGVYDCMATRNKTNYDTEHSDGRSLQISEIPVPSLVPITQWQDVFPTESVTLSCGMEGSSDWTYSWRRDGTELWADDALSFDADAATLSIRSASESHGGRYSCSGELKSRPVSSKFSSELTLDVYDAKPIVVLTQTPSHSVMHTGDSVSFSCHINQSSGWEYLWYKDGAPLAEFGKSLNITSVLTKNDGSYRCQTKRGRTAAFSSDQSPPVRLEIKERPKANIILLTGWSEVFSTDSLVLKCGVQELQDSWNFTWFKGDQLLDLPPSERHTVTPQNDPAQSVYTCRGTRIGRPSYSKISDHFKTNNLLLKRRLLLSISGCLFFGIIFTFIGCIVLRVFRKQAKDEYKPEEADLFLSMNRIKNCDDVPCPVVEYITDASLTAPPKDGDENGLISSEAPLPITTQDDPAATTESHEAEETNGGLVSFKQ